MMMTLLNCLLLEKVNGKESDGVHPAKWIDNEQHLKNGNFEEKIITKVIVMTNE